MIISNGQTMSEDSNSEIIQYRNVSHYRTAFGVNAREEKSIF
jgi:hypothetical protein